MRAMKHRSFANLDAVRRFAAFLPPAADILVAFATIVCRFAAFAGASRRRPLPVHTKRVCRLLCKHSQAAKSAFWAFPSGNFSPAFEKAGQKGRRDVVPVAFMGENRITAVFSPNSMITSAIILHCRRQNRRLPE